MKTEERTQEPACIYVDGMTPCHRPAEYILRIREGQAMGDLPLCEKHLGRLAVTLAPMRKREKRDERG